MWSCVVNVWCFMKFWFYELMTPMKKQKIFSQMGAMHDSTTLPTQKAINKYWILIAHVWSVILFLLIFTTTYLKSAMGHTFLDASQFSFPLSRFAIEKPLSTNCKFQGFTLIIPILHAFFEANSTSCDKIRFVVLLCRVTFIYYLSHMPIQWWIEGYKWL